MLFCLNPNCNNPENPDHHNYCHGCQELLAQSSQSYLFKNRYRITKKIGEGAFGRTYLAEDSNFDNKKRVIKKLIATGTGTNLTKVKELFQREAQTLDELQNPHIPRIYDYFDENNNLFLIQEYIEGETLYSEWLRQGNFSEAKIKQALEELLPVLEYLHKSKILHRDIKPDNIMRRKSDGRLFLIDFGGAKQTNQTLQSSPGTRLYTPGYASREHMRGRPKASSDIYSLGVTMVRLLTGCFPDFDNQGNIDDPLYNEDQGCWIWRNYGQNKGIKINPHLAKVLEKMIEDLANNRYPSATEALNDLNLPQVIPPNPPPINPPVKPKSTVVMTRNLQNNSSQSNQITRASFLKYLGMAGAGVIGTIMVNSLLNQQNKFSGFISSIKSLFGGINWQTFSFETVQVDSYGTITTKETKTAEYFTIDLGNGVTMDLVKIPGGTFMMGTDDAEIARLNQEYNIDWFSNESPQHEVTVPTFAMSKYPVTQAQWQAVMGTNPSNFQDPPNLPLKGGQGDRPVEQVSWDDCVNFCQKLSEKISKKITLPSEAQWEYACRAGTTTPFYFGETITTDLVNYNGNDPYGEEPNGGNRQETTAVGSFPPNAFGLYDMHGNVWEWCEDDYAENYQNTPTDGTSYINQSMKYKCIRGGSWYSDSNDCRSASRAFYVHHNGYYVGFRVMCLLF